MGKGLSTVSHKDFTWYDFIHPTHADLDFLTKKFKFHELDREDVLTENQRPKIDEYENYLFIVLHFPIWNQKKKLILTEEVNIFIGQNFLVTLHSGELAPLSEAREKCHRMPSKRDYLERGSGWLLYKLIRELFDYCFPLLDNLSRTVTSIEQSVFDTESPQDLLREIMLLKKNIIAFRRILSPERTVVSALEHKNKKFLPPDLEVYFDDIVDKIEKLWGSLDSLKEVSETLQNANESLISHKTGDTIRVLTVFSVIMLPLTLIVGIFGMNVPLPDAQNPYAFLQIVGSMLTITILMVLFFRWKKWL